MQLKHQNERLQAEIEDLVVDHQHLMQRQTEDGAGYERRLEGLNAEIGGLRRMVQGKEEYIHQQSLEVDQYRDKCLTLESELARRLEERDSLESKLRHLQEQLYLQKGSTADGGTLKVEVEQLKRDNERMLRMLR